MRETGESGDAMGRHGAGPVDVVIDDDMNESGQPHVGPRLAGGLGRLPQPVAVRPHGQGRHVGRRGRGPDGPRAGGGEEHLRRRALGGAGEPRETAVVRERHQPVLEDLRRPTACRGHGHLVASEVGLHGRGVRDELLEGDGGEAEPAEGAVSPADAEGHAPPGLHVRGHDGGGGHGGVSRPGVGDADSQTDAAGLQSRRGQGDVGISHQALGVPEGEAVPAGRLQLRGLVHAGHRLHGRP